MSTSRRSLAWPAHGWSSPTTSATSWCCCGTASRCGTAQRTSRSAGFSEPKRQGRAVDAAYSRLRPELRYAVRSNLTVLSLLEPRLGMPDPGPQRATVAAVLRRLERLEGDVP